MYGAISYAARKSNGSNAQRHADWALKEIEDILAELPKTAQKDPVPATESGPQNGPRGPAYM